MDWESSTYVPCIGCEGNDACDRLPKINDSRQQQQQQQQQRRRRQNVGALAEAASAVAVATKRVPVVYRTTHAVALAHTNTFHTYDSTYTPEATTPQRLMAAASSREAQLQ